MNNMDEMVLEEVAAEIEEARLEHGDYNSPHEAYAVIKEELDEFWDIVKMKTAKRSASAMKKELNQIACTAIRAVNDLALHDGLNHKCAGRE